MARTKPDYLAGGLNIGVLGLAIAAGMALLMALTGCTAGGSTDFWGNPAPSQRPAADAICDQPTLVPGFHRADDGDVNGWHQRPSDVAPGNNWVLLGVSVRALATNDLEGMHNRFCAPIRVHIELSALEHDVDLARHPGGRSYDIEATTPWENHYIPVDYNPAEERFQGRPPYYRITVTATYLGERDVFLKSPDVPIALGCEIKLMGASVSTDLATLPGISTVECEFVSNSFVTW